MWHDIKALYDKPIADIILNSLKSSSLKISRVKYLLSIVLGILTKQVGKKKEKTSILEKRHIVPFCSCHVYK